MALPPFNREVLEAAVAHHGGVFGVGEGSDVDEAFDSANTLADEHPSPNSSTFSLANPAAVETVEYSTGSFDEAVSIALGWLAENPNSEAVAAIAFLGRSAHSRVTRRARIQGVDLPVNDTPASTWTAPAAELADAFNADAGPAGDETLETLTIGRRARYKPVVVVHNKLQSEGRFILVDGDTIVSRGYATAGDARRAAVAMHKELPNDDHATGKLEVFKLSGREGGRPLIEVIRTRVAQTLSIKAVYATRKQAAKGPKVAGWLFVTPRP